MSYYDLINEKQVGKRFLLHDLISNKTKHFVSGKQLFLYKMSYIPHQQFKAFDLKTGKDISKDSINYITR